MSKNTAKRIVDWIFSERIFHDTSRIIFDFIGGEPLIEVSLIEETISYAYSRMLKDNNDWAENFKVRITTNGLLYASPEVQGFLQKYKNHIDISISIDGIKRKHDENRIFPNGHGSYKAILPNVKLWIKQFPQAHTKMTISHVDLPYVKESLIHLMELGLSFIDVNTVLEDVWTEGDDFILETELIALADYIITNNLWKKHTLSCFDEDLGKKADWNTLLTPCGDLTVAVDAREYLYPCVRYKQYSLREKAERPIGTLSDGLSQNHMRPFLSFDARTVFPEECMTCEVSNLCKWCPAESYDASLTGTIFQRSISHCRMHKAIVRANNYYQRKLNVITDNYEND